MKKYEEYFGINIISTNLNNSIDVDFLTEDIVNDVEKFHTSIDEYKKTPLVKLDNLASKLGVKNIFVKDESYRYGLNAFKGLGGLYAIFRIVCDKLNLDYKSTTFKDFAFYDCLNNYKNIYNNIVPIEDMNKTLSQDIFWLHDEEIFMWMAYDITEKIENKKHADQVKQDTMELAQTVINKQMTVVQEIGRLLGETTAETKVILSRVKNLINEDNSSDNLRNP